MTGVTVVTCRDADGQPIGFTANSFSSVSLDPPLVLVCIANTSRNYRTVTRAGGFAINVLSEHQKDISTTFARPVEDRFSAVKWHSGPNGAPVLDGVSAWFDCAMHKIVEAGDHAILICHVRAFYANQTPGLGYARGAYITPGLEAAALSARGSGVTVSALIERRGQVLLLQDADGGMTIPRSLVGKEGASAALRSLTQQIGLNTVSGFIYSVYEDAESGRHNICFLCHAQDGTPGTGAFVRLDGQTLNTIADPALKGMLTRFGQESKMGNYGIYFGNHAAGEVRQLRPGTDQARDL